MTHRSPRHHFTLYSGDVMYLEILGKPIIVVNSVKAAVDLLDKRSANYSDRPRFPIFKLYIYYFVRLSLANGLISFQYGLDGDIDLYELWKTFPEAPQDVPRTPQNNKFGTLQTNADTRNSYSSPESVFG